jgi:multidrug efflux pump subunit AcrA (membrane-fusion protein)
MINKLKESIEEICYFLQSAEGRKKIFAALFLLLVLSGIYQSLAPPAWPMNFLKRVLAFSNEDKFIINKDDFSLLPVKVMQIQSRKVTPAISVLGTIEYQDKVALTAKTDGRIEKIYARVGDKVHKGMLLVQLERLPLQLELNKKIASLAVARADFNLAKRE